VDLLEYACTCSFRFLCICGNCRQRIFSPGAILHGVVGHPFRMFGPYMYVFFCILCCLSVLGFASVCAESVMFNSYFPLVSCYFLFYVYFVYDFIINKINLPPYKVCVT